MPYKEKFITKKYWTIGEVAKMVTSRNVIIVPSKIRFWEQEFKAFINPKRNRKGVRKFTDKDIITFLYLIYFVHSQGYTLDGARRKLQLIKDGFGEPIHDYKPGDIISVDGVLCVLNKPNYEKLI